MKRMALGRAAVSCLMVATTMVGCSGAAFRPHGVAAKQGTPDKMAATAEKALAARDGAAAVRAAEAAVQSAPDNAAYRQLLGRAYMLDGRFLSAQTALTDAMTLGNNDARTIVSLALVNVALGKNDTARALLADHADTVPAADYGLAIALAGDADEGVHILSQAIHDPSATARTRQNLAYAYALAGRWKDARTVAGLDLAPLAANQRISQWAMTAGPAMAPQRVAAMMGVTINAADAGQPVMLALAPAARDAAPVALAEASAAPEVPAEPAIRMAAVEPAPAARTLTARIIETAAPVAKPVPAPVPAARMRQVAYIKPVASGASNWVVQLGAYDSPAVAKDKWAAMVRTNGRIAAFPVLTSQATVNGKRYHRLAIGGFGSRADAQALCQTIKAQRGQCFVRETAPNAMPQRWAAAPVRGRQFAAR